MKHISKKNSGLAIGLWGSLILSVVFPILFGLLLIGLLPDWRMENYPLHAMVETVGSVAALTIATLMIIMLNNNHLDHHHIMVACALISMGILDGFHAVLNVSISFVWLHSIATMAGGALFALVVLPKKLLSNERQKYLLYTTLTLSILTGIISISFPDILPTMIIDGQFSLTAIFINITGGVGFIIGSSYFIYNHRKANQTQNIKNENMVFANHCLLFGTAALLFELSILWDAGWWWWHILRLLAYLIVLFYLFFLFKNSQEKTFSNQERYRSVIESRMVGILFWEETGEITDANDVFLTMTGYSKDEILSNQVNWGNITPAEYKKLDDNGINELVTTGVMTPYEKEYIRKDGTRIPVLLGAATLPGKNMNGVAFILDITRRKHAEESLQSSYELNKNIINESPIGIAIYNQDGQCIETNEAVANIVGATQEQLLKQNYNEIESWKKSGLYEAAKKSIQLQEKIRHEFDVLTTFDKQAFFDCQLVPFTLDNEQHLLIMIDDTSKRKQDEIELEKHRNHLEEMVNKRTQKLINTQSELVRKERLATLGQLTATVSHELRNPLAAMRPALYMLDKKTNNKDETISKALKNIDRNINRCDHIIDDLLDFTRITELNAKEILFDEWLNSVIDEQTIPEGIVITKELNLRNINLLIDTNRFRRAVINIIDNSCHSMLDNNLQTVTTKNAHINIKTLTNASRVEIIITDTGCGMTKDTLDKIFEPLFSTKAFGVGLGMSTIKQIMRQHSGDIEINSEKSKGTTVILWLPLNKATENNEEII